MSDNERRPRGTTPQDRHYSTTNPNDTPRGTDKASNAGALVWDTMRHYVAAGWHPFPLPPRRKAYPPTGYTGHAAKDVTTDQVEAWASEGEHPDDSNVGLRMPDGVLGLDVDHYHDGHKRIAEVEASLGCPLPDGPRTLSGRGDGSGHRMFRVPRGRVWVSDLGEGSGVEVLQPHHRYSVVYPSVHPKTGRTYEWVGGVIPNVEDVPELPEAWVERLTRKDEERATINPTALANPRKDQMSRAQAEVDDLVRQVRELAEGNRHNGLLKRARTVGGYAVWLGSGGLENAIESLSEAAQGIGLGAGEARRTATDGVVYGALVPLALPSSPEDDFTEDTLPPLPLESKKSPEEELESKVAKRAQDKLIDHLASERLKIMLRPERPPFDAGLLSEHLLKPEPPPARVQGLIPWEASTEAIAQKKAGKTTLGLNFAHSLITGPPFLGRFPVIPVQGTVALLNYEVSGHQIRTWAKLRGIPEDRFHITNLRGTINPFRDPRDQKELAAVLRGHGVETLIVDPFGRAFPGDNQNDAGQVQSWLVRLDEFARAEVGALDLMLTVHAGWSDDGRARGSSALEDWPDAMLYLTKAKNSENRYLRADGRDVKLEKQLLHMDDATKTLTLAPPAQGTHTEEPVARPELMQRLSEVLEALPLGHPGLSGNAVRDAVTGKSDDKRAALKALIDGGYVATKWIKQTCHHTHVRPYVASQEAARGDFAEGGQQ